MNLGIPCGTGGGVNDRRGSALSDEYAVHYKITANNVTPPYIHIPLPLDIQSVRKTRRLLAPAALGIR